MNAVQDISFSPQSTSQIDDDYDPGFTFYNADDNTFHEIDNSLRFKLLHDIQRFIPQVVAFQTSFPFLLFEYDDEIPATTKLPFKVAGCLAVFIDIRDGYPWGAGFIGQVGEGLPKQIQGTLKQYTIPSISVFEEMFSTMADARNISYFPKQLLVELKETSDETYQDLLTSLPCTIGGIPVGYFNGKVFKNKRGRVTEPNPQKQGSTVSDETNYLSLENGGKLRPGCSIYCPGKVQNGQRSGECWSTSGIAVIKDGERRLTVALHTFDTGSDAQVYHGEQSIGEIKETYGEDIALVMSDVEFENVCFDGSVLTGLARSETLKSFEHFMMDSFVTGKQILVAMGIRCGLRRMDDTPGPASDRVNVVVEQGIYSCGAHYMKKPFIREGTCGTPLVRMRPKGHVGQYEGEGEVVGLMLWNDVKQYTTMLYCFAEPVDELVDQGWSMQRDNQ